MGEKERPHSRGGDCDKRDRSCGDGPSRARSFPERPPGVPIARSRTVFTPRFCSLRCLLSAWAAPVGRASAGVALEGRLAILPPSREPSVNDVVIGDGPAYRAADCRPGSHLVIGDPRIERPAIVVGGIARPVGGPLREPSFPPGAEPLLIGPASENTSDLGVNPVGVGPANGVVGVRAQPGVHPPESDHDRASG